MKFPKLLTVLFVLAMLSLNAQAQNSGPFLWTGYIDVLGNYLRSDDYPGGGTFSRFTPGVAITVTRVQLQAAYGSSVYNTKLPCHPVPKIRVTDGTTKYDLGIPNAREKGRYPMAVSADSGLISVGFSGSAALSLLIIPGETGCDGGSINVTVQYSVN
jgi:hypothetical protein